MASSSSSSAPALFKEMTPEQREALLAQGDNFMGVAKRFVTLLHAIGIKAECTPEPLDRLFQNTERAYSAWVLARHLPSLVDPFSTLTHLWAGMGQANMMRNMSVANLGLDGTRQLVADIHRFTGYLLDDHTSVDTSGFEETDLKLVFRYMSGIEGFIKYFASKVAPAISDLVDMSPVDNTFKTVGVAFEAGKKSGQVACTPDSLRSVIDLCDKYAVALGLEQLAPVVEPPGATSDPDIAPSSDSSS